MSTQTIGAGTAAETRLEGERGAGGKWLWLTVAASMFAAAWGGNEFTPLLVMLPTRPRLFAGDGRFLPLRLRRRNCAGPAARRPAVRSIGSTPDHAPRADHRDRRFDAARFRGRLRRCSHPGKNPLWHRLGDRYGRRRLLGQGVVHATLGSDGVGRRRCSASSDESDRGLRLGSGCCGNLGAVGAHAECVGVRVAHRDHRPRRHGAVACARNTTGTGENPTVAG